ncbi:MAG: threonylcarbamoyl-AMP synthase [Rickettsiaceae bacterium H1]|nr:threonylcarbamoyl-AMP synthase [Rickettsiaceae bacterium H1]
MVTASKQKKITKTLFKGSIVCFPTETLYALAVDAYNVNAIENLYHVKKRELNKPFAVMVPDFSFLGLLVTINRKQLSLMQKHLPGSVTFLLSRSKNFRLPEILGEKIGIRIPKHKKALSILKSINKPIATTSANFSCTKDAKKFIDIPQKILEQVGYYIKDDSKISGIGSTVIDITKEPFKVIRKGVFQLK